MRAFLPPALLGLVAFYWLNILVQVFLLMPLGGDQGIFQYIASAIRAGDIMYLDIREVNGPGTAVIHVVMQWLGGSDTQVFRSLDLRANILVFGFFGAMLPGLVGSPRSPERALSPSLWARAGWAVAAVCVLLTCYLQFDFWSTAQRESFALWFLLPSVALQMNAQGMFRGETKAHAQARQRNLLIASAVLTALCWFIKPTFGVFSLAQLVSVGVGEGPLSRLRRISWFALTAALTAVLGAILLSRFVDFRLWFELLVEARNVYRFMWNKAVAEIWASNARAEFAMAHAMAFFGIAGVSLRVLPPRLLCVMLFPFAAALHLTLQHKGFGYHYIPLMQLVRAVMLVLVAFIGELAWRSISDRRLAGFLAILPMMWLSFHTANEAASSPSMNLSGLLEGEELEPAAKLGSAEYYRLFNSRHTPFLEQEQAAEYLRNHTRRRDRIQVYGRDPWVLFLAQRLSATPFMYVTDFNMSRSLAGSGYTVPTDDEREVIVATAEAHDKELLSYLVTAPPSRFVFVDVKGLINVHNAAKDFIRNAPQSGGFLKRNYEEEKLFGPIRIWKKKRGASLQ